jgi:hypothetical protein
VGAELQSGIIQELQAKPAHLTALFTKREADKIRPLKDYSAPKGAAVNDYADANRFKNDVARGCLCTYAAIPIHGKGR